MIDVTWLTDDEREELRRALVTYKVKLTRQADSRSDVIAQRDAGWRLHVVETLLRTVDPQ